MELKYSLLSAFYFFIDIASSEASSSDHSWQNTTSMTLYYDMLFVLQEFCLICFFICIVYKTVYRLQADLARLL